MNKEVPVTLTQTATESMQVTEESFLPAEGNSFTDATSVIESSKIPEALDFIKEDSKNVKELANWFNANMDTVKLVNENTVSIETEDGDKMIVYLEDYIRHDIDSIFTKINNL